MVANSRVPKELFIGSGSEGDVVVELWFVVEGVTVVSVLDDVVEELDIVLVVVVVVVLLLLMLLADKSLSRNSTAILLSQEQ